MTKRVPLVVLLLLALFLVAGCTGPFLPPIAGFTACPDGWRNDLDMQFASTSQSSAGHALVFYRWEFGDGAEADDYYGWTTHRYVAPGTYTVRLTVTDDRGVKAAAEQEIVVARAVALGDIEFSLGYPSRAVGEIVNQSAFYLYSASIKVKFYDGEGVRVAETMVDVQSIDSGERVRFSAEVPPGIVPVAAAVAFVQSFAAACSGRPIPVPIDGK